MSATELDRIRERYKRRAKTYEPWVPWIYMTRHELERVLMQVLLARGLLPPHEARILDVGCGTGAHLHFFLRLGFRPEKLAGIELQPERLATARSQLPSSITLVLGDASQVDLPEASFDVVFQSLVFSSILDDQLQLALAQKMWSLTRPGGGILWYDFTWNNPQNPDVKGVRPSKLRELFPEAIQIFRRVTLAPPIARRVTRVHPAMYSVFGCIPFLRTHVVGWLAKPVIVPTPRTRESS